MKAAKNKSAPSGGGSRTLNYLIVIVISFLVFYFLIYPSFAPKATSTTSTTTSAGAGTISLSPSTDIAGTLVTVSGQALPANKSVTATFGPSSVQLNGTSGACITTSGGAIDGCTFLVPRGSSPGTYTVGIAAGTTTVKADFTIPQYSPPVSTVVVTLTSLALGFVTQLVTRRVVDLDKERKMRAEVNAFNKEKREATLANDKARLEKLKRRELQVRQEQAKVSTARFKVTAITFVPLLVVYYLMASFLGGFNVMVAHSPIPVPLLAAPLIGTGHWWVSLFWWYFLSSFTFSTMLSKLLHTTT